MSWSIMIIGKPKAVAAKVDHKIEKTTVTMEPELEIQKKIGDVICTALASYPDESVVHVEASGLQYDPTLEGVGVVNQVTLKIEFVYGFVE